MSAIVLDVETTGFSPDNDRITEICIADFDTAEILVHTYVNPGIPIPEDVTKITGITNEMVAEAPPFFEVCPGVVQAITGREVVIGHNPWFDRGFVCAEVRRAGSEIQYPLVICTKRTWDIYEPKESRHLTNAYKRFTGKDLVGAHGAKVDTLGCLEVMKKQLEEFGLVGKPWAEFDPEQKIWWGPSNHIIWKDNVLYLNFGKHKGTPLHLVERSYWNWVLKQDFPEHVMVAGDYLTMVARPGITAGELAAWAYGRKFQ